MTRSAPDPSACMLRVGALPLTLSGFVGREEEIATLTALVTRPDVRLLTITGPGGVGKTRLAVETARTLAGAFPEGMIFVSLAATNDPERVPAAIARALSLEPRADLTAADAVRAAIAGRQILLVLDNLEHLLPASLFLVDLLGACPAVTILATSRTRLNLSGEQVYALNVLSVVDARTLFRHRVRAQDEGREVTGDGATIDAICTRLDRMPLAIELAAARTATLPPEALLERLSQPLSLLRNGPRDVPLRHQTMRDTIAWSYDLLDEREKAGFRRLAVFVGGFTLEGAQAVLGDEGDALDLVDFLVQRSLVVPMQGESSHPRFTMLESIRQFGVEMLPASGEDDAIRAAHADWLIDLGEYAIPFYDGPRLYEFVSVVRDEMNNIRGALAWSLDRRDGTRANRLAGIVWRNWQDDGMSWLPTATWQERLQEGVSWTDRALALREGVPSRYLLESLAGRLFLAVSMDQCESMSVWADDLLQHSREVGDALFEHWSHLALSDVACARGDRDGARAELALALEAAGRARDPENQICGIYSALARLELRYDNPPAAEAHGRMALEYGLRCGNPHNLGRATAVLAIALYQQEKWQDAVLASIENLQYLAMQRDLAGSQMTTLIVADAALIAKRPGDAVRLLAYADTVPRFSGSDPALLEAILARARAVLPACKVSREWEAGTVLTPDDVRQIAQRVVAALEAGNDCVASPATDARLSPREVEVLLQLTTGKSNRAIGEVLFISERTVERHIFQMMTKLDLDSRTAIVAWALRNGVVT